MLRLTSWHRHSTAFAADRGPVWMRKAQRLWPLPFAHRCHRLGELARYSMINHRRIHTMRRIIFAVGIAASAVPALAADVAVSITAGQPGYYGRIDIGSFPQPQLVYAQPIVIERVPVGVVLQPTYLHVPPGHAKNWRKHCGKYNACGQPVYFRVGQLVQQCLCQGSCQGPGQRPWQGKEERLSDLRTRLLSSVRAPQDCVRATRCSPPDRRSPANEQAPLCTWSAGEGAPRRALRGRRRDCGKIGPVLNTSRPFAALRPTRTPRV